MRLLARLLPALLLGAVAGCSRSHEPAAAPAPAPAPRTATRAPVSAPGGPLTRTAALASADELIHRTNGERHGAKLLPLTRSANLMRAADMQAAQMARANMLEHDIPTAAYPTLGARLNAVQYPIRAAGENIGEGYRTPAAAITGWMASPGHRANILSVNYTEIGTAVATSSNGTMYWVQVFGRPR